MKIEIFNQSKHKNSSSNMMIIESVDLIIIIPDHCSNNDHLINQIHANDQRQYGATPTNTHFSRYPPIWREYNQYSLSNTKYINPPFLMITAVFHKFDPILKFMHLKGKP